MTDIMVFHGITGLEPGAAGLEEALEAAGHRLHSPDLFDGHHFEDPREGFEYLEEVRFRTLAERAEEAIADLPADTVLIGISMGTGVATHLARRRPETAAVVLLHAAPGRAKGEPDWPAGVPVEIHSSEGDPYFSRENADALTAEAADGRLVLYPGSGHTFGDPLAPEDYDAEQAPVLVTNVLEFIEHETGMPTT